MVSGTGVKGAGGRFSKEGINSNVQGSGEPQARPVFGKAAEHLPKGLLR